jgi:formate dehydrogenase subunit gamma
MTSRTRLYTCLVVACGATIALLAPLALGQNGKSPDKPADNTIPHDDMQACLACHESEQGAHKAVNVKALGVSPHKDLKCQDCHTAINAFPHTPDMLKQKAACANCHTDQAEAYNRSSHAHKDFVKGDHPNCITCHGGGDPHAIVDAGKWPRARKVALCSNCHRQAHRMTKYGVDPDAVSSYEESFHGKALLRFGNLKVAICTDCHGHHDVLNPDNPAAPTNRANAAKTCGQPGCHAGAKVNFAMSGANHLRLKAKKVPILHFEEIFFRVLTGATILFLLGGVALDLRREIFHVGPEPKPGRFLGLLVSISFLFVVIALGMAVLGIRGARWSGIAALVIMALALLLYAVRPHKKNGKHETRYQRFTIAQRLQHGLLALSFTTLVLTGMPLRFPQIGWLRALNLALGGLAVSRYAHRVAAVVLIGTWIWHTLYLIYRWHKAGYKMESWTMWPSRKDLRDFIEVSRYYLGFAKAEPKYGRFQFREKFDYFAVYWGMPIMVISGLVLWFPIYFGNRLPEIGLSMAYVAHSDEAVLAFLTIILWHFYNTHFNVDTFPMNPVFYSGTLTREEMEREHPLELEQIEASGTRVEQTSDGPE